MQIFNQSSNRFTTLALGVSEGKVGALSNKIKSERQLLISFFVENLRNKQNKKFPAKMIAVKLSHLSMEDLRHTISVFKDNLNRKGLNGASKEFWWSIKVK